MIINKPESNIFGSKITSNNFSIKSSPKAFQILSSNLYSNKIRAVIREYSCNALDAHRYAGIEDKPFRVQLPSRLDQQFIVRDYGNGLSPEDIIDLFTTYFSSTKDASNDYTGALGLGSKSAFSYTESFSCISYWNNKKYSYTLFLDAGEPKVTLFHEEPTKEPSGVEIIIPVKYEDVEDFLKEAEFVYAAFDIKPLGIEHLGEIPVVNINKNIGYIKLEKNNDFSYVYNKPIFARMGNVFYQIDFATHFNVELRDIVYNLNYLGFKSYNKIFFINFEIGELDIAPSREQLSYDNNTLQNIRNKLKEINFSGLVEEHFLNNKESLADSKSWIEYNQKTSNLFNSTLVNIFRDETIRDIIEKNNIIINGCTLEEYVNLIDNYFTSPLYTRDPKAKSTCYFNFYYRKHNSMVSDKGYNPDRIRRVLIDRFYLSVDSYFVVLKNIEDKWEGTKSYFKEYAWNKYPDNEYVVIESTSEYLNDVKLYLEDQYKNTNIVIVNFSDIIQDMKTEKSKLTVKASSPNVNKTPLDNLFENLPTLDSKRSKADKINLYGKNDFRKYIKNNPDKLFVVVSWGDKNSFEIKFTAGNNYNLKYSLSADALNSILDFCSDKEELLSKMVFVRYDFRWLDLIDENKKWLDIQKINSPFTNIPEDIFIDILFSFGYVGNNRISYARELFNTKDSSEEFNKVKELFVNLAWENQKNSWNNSIRLKEEFERSLINNYNYKLELRSLSDSIELMIRLLGKEVYPFYSRCKVKLVDKLIKMNNIFKVIFDMCNEDSEKFLEIIEIFNEKGSLKEKLINQ